MAAVANPPNFPHIVQKTWTSNAPQAGFNSMNSEEGGAARMFMPRKSAQRANSSSSISSNASTSSTSSTSSNGTIKEQPVRSDGASAPNVPELMGYDTSVGRKKLQRTGPWPAQKAEPVSGVTNARSQSIISTNGASAQSAMTSIHRQPSSIVPSQHAMNQPPSQQQNGARPAAQANGDQLPVLCLLSMNGTFDRKQISVPFWPDNMRIGRQTNAKTLPAANNGYFDSKVLSRQHAEIWADKNGKIWIRDVKSSNGTFVNGHRLSLENRESEPHELQAQDHLELGIDIVSEDQKTVVHHKVAAKVELAGFPGPSTNIMDMNFGDLDPANGAMMVHQQSFMGHRGRTPSSQGGSIGPSGRIGPQGGMPLNMHIMNPPRPMHRWLAPVGTEEIVRKLTHEMRNARLQTTDLTRATQFFDSLLSKDDFKEPEKPSPSDNSRHSHFNGGSLPFRLDGNKPRFSDPPAPPPQQPLPEKPDVSRPSSFDPSMPPLSALKRTTTERPRSVTSGLPVRQDANNSQIINLVEQLASAKKEIDTQSARMRDLEEMLQREREARETAEEVLKRLEEERMSKANGSAKKTGDGSLLEQALRNSFELPTEEDTAGESKSESPDHGSPSAAVEASKHLQQKMEQMMLEMDQLKQQMQTYQQRADQAEAERDSSRQSLAEMVAKIRADDQARQAASDNRSETRSSHQPSTSLSNPTIEELSSSLEKSLQQAAREANADSNTAGKGVKTNESDSLVMALTRPPGSNDLLHQSTPYASMVGVVLLGMGIMAYINGWQKVER